MEATHGTWGRRIITFKWDGGIVTILYLESFNRCSWHSHRTTYNQFYCIEGKVGIKTDKGYITWLEPGQSFTVEPGVVHEFRTESQKAVIEEIAYVKYDYHDIDRKLIGGPLRDACKSVM